MSALDVLVTPSLRFEEILSDGSTLSNPAADTRRLFLGEDGLLHLKDSAGTVTDVNGRRTRKTDNEAFSATAYADSTNMALAIEASKNYAFRYVIFYTTNATSVGIKLALKGPASCTCYAGIFGSITLGTLGGTATMVAGVQASGDISTDLPVLEPATGPGTTATMAIIEGVLNNGVNAGNLVLRHASETATATTILANSYGELYEIA